MYFGGSGSSFLDLVDQIQGEEAGTNYSMADCADCSAYNGGC